MCQLTNNSERILENGWSYCYYEEVFSLQIKYDKCALELSCEYGELKNAKNCLDSSKYIKIRHCSDAFVGACTRGHIGIAKWLHDLGVDIHVDNNAAFIRACEYQHFEIVKWLCELDSTLPLKIFDEINYLHMRTPFGFSDNVFSVLSRIKKDN